MKTNIRKMVLLAMLTAVSFLVVAMIRIPVVLFLSYEPKDVIITIGGFLLGPMASFVISLVVALLEMVTISSTGPIGCLMNLLSSACFACTASFVYKRRHTLSGAMIGLGIGSVAMTSVMLLWNYLITPLYMGVDRSYVAGLLVPAFLPFNLLKAGFNSALTLGLYKPLSTALRKTGLLESRGGAGAAPKSGSRVGVYLLAAGLLITCTLLLLVLQGKL